MTKYAVRNLMLALSLVLLTIPAGRALAQSATPASGSSAASSSDDSGGGGVTGTDPEPIDPGATTADPTDPSPDGVTGTDPEPIDPGMILTALFV